MSRRSRTRTDGSETRAEATSSGTARRPDWALAVAVLALGTVCLVLTLRCTRHRPFVGSPDQAAYVHQAEQILAGRGSEILYVQHFYRQYPEVAHPEDHYGIGQGLLVALSFLVAGPSDWAATLPSAVLGCLCLPPLVYFAARRLGAPPVWAFAAAVVALLDREVLAHERMALCDLQFAVLGLAAWLAAAGGVETGSADRRRWLRPLLAGAALAAAYALKPAALFLLPGVLLTAVLADASASRRERLGAVCLVLAAFLLPIAPWLLRNAREFGSPFYSANQYIGPAADYLGRGFQADHFRKVWWASGELPWGYGDLPSRFGLATVGSVIGARLREAFLDGGRWGYTLALLLCPLASRGRRPAGLLGALVALYLLGLCLLFTVHPRYVMLLPAAGAAAGAALLGGLWEQAASARRTVARLAPVAAMALALGVGWAGLRYVWTDARAHWADGSRGAIRPSERLSRDAALWARGALAGEGATMVPDCWTFARYAHLPCVNLPLDRPEAVEAVVRHYRVRWLLLAPSATYGWTSEWARDYLARYGDGWRQVEGAPAGCELYRRRESG